MIPGPLLPYIGIAALLAIGGAYYAGNVQGHTAENAAWETKVAAQKIEAARLLSESKDRALAVERENAALKDTIERTAADARSEIDRALAANRELVRTNGGLRVKVSRCGIGPAANVPPTGDTASGRDGPLTDGVLSGQASAGLIELAADADRVMSAARACQAWAQHTDANTLARTPR